MSRASSTGNRLDLGAITAEVILVRRAEAQRRDVQIDIALAEAPAAGDPRLVESLVANLIDNAIRHNVPGGHVDVTTSPSGDGGSITVRNTGPMIPPAEVGRLFVPFQRLHTERIRHPDGHGLGLAIVLAITTAHGALLTATALESGGLDVRVAFPALPPGQQLGDAGGAERRHLTGGRSRRGRPTPTVRRRGFRSRHV